MALLAVACGGILVCGAVAAGLATVAVVATIVAEYAPDVNKFAVGVQLSAKAINIVGYCTQNVGSFSCVHNAQQTVTQAGQFVLNQSQSSPSCL